MTLFTPIKGLVVKLHLDIDVDVCMHVAWVETKQCRGKANTRLTDK